MRRHCCRRACDRQYECGLRLYIDTGQRAKPEVAPKNGASAGRQVAQAADEAAQDVEKPDLLAGESPVTSESELPVKVLDRQLVRIVEWKAAQLRRHRERHLDEEIGRASCRER